MTDELWHYTRRQRHQLFNFSEMMNGQFYCGNTLVYLLLCNRMPIKNEDKLYGSEMIIKFDMSWAITRARAIRIFWEVTSSVEWMKEEG